MRGKKVGHERGGEKGGWMIFKIGKKKKKKNERKRESEIKFTKSRKTRGRKKQTCV